MALDVKYKILYPFLTTFEYRVATPGWDQSRPTAGKMLPRTSDLKINFITLSVTL